MALGEAIKQDFILILSKPKGAQAVVDLPNSTTDDCCFSLPVLALPTGGDSFTNDFSAALFWFGENYSAATLYLQKYENGAWGNIATLTNDTYGKNYAYGFEVNELGEKLAGYKINWQSVLSAEGEGDYRIKAEATLITSGTDDFFSLEYCLKRYTPYRADFTVRLEFTNSGITGDIEDDEGVKDYGTLDWVNQIRLPDSLFGYDNSTSAREFVRYQNGQQIWIQDEQTQKYKLVTGRFPSWLHNYIKINVLQSDEIKITDYNKNNANIHKDRKVIVSGDYSPEWVLGSQFAKVEVEFDNAFVNHRKKRC